MRILSLETATYFGGTALLNTEDDAVASAGPFPSRGTSRELMNAVDRLMSQWNWTFDSLDGVAVSTGPGLFTGVRVGLSIAKTLCWAGAETPVLVGVSTLHAVATLVSESAEADQPVVAATDARRGEVYAALFVKKNDGRMNRLGEDIVVRPERLGDRLPPRASIPILAGDTADRYGEILRELFGAEAQFVDCRQCNLAETIARIGARRIANGQSDVPQSLEPNYVRRPDARRPAMPDFLKSS